MSTSRSILALAVSSSIALAASAQDSNGLEEVVVTAQRVQTNLQETPISILQVSGEQMYELGAENVQELAKFMPNVSVAPSNNGGEPNFSVRGVSQIRTGISGDRSVGFYVDGQYFPRTTGSLMQALDLANVEIMRGPQGTLFGRNNTGGAISITTQKPTQKLEGSVRVGLGQLNRRDVSGVINAPLNDRIAFRGSIASYNRDGYVKGDNGQTRGDVDDLLWRAALRFDITDNLTLDVAYTDVDSKSAGFASNRQGHVNPSSLSVLACQAAGACPSNANQFVRFSPTSAWVGIPVDMNTPYTDSLVVTGDPLRYVGGDKEFNNTQTRFANATLNWRMTDHLTVRSITGGMKIGTESFSDSDQSPWPVGNSGSSLDHQSWSEELHLIGDGFFNNRLHFISGLYKFHEKNQQDTWNQSYGGTGRFQPWQIVTGPGQASATFPGIDPAYPFVTMQPVPGMGLVPFGLCPYIYPFAGSAANPQPTAGSVPLMGCFNTATVGKQAANRSANHSTADSWAVFTDATFKLTDKLTVGGGVRYTEDKKTWFVQGASTSYGTILSTKEGDWGSTDWRFITQYQWTPDVMTYLNVAKAYKAGGLTDTVPFGFGGFPGFGENKVGVDTRNPITGEIVDSPFIPYNPESVINAELGLRSEWFDQRLRTNVSVFSMDYKDKQQEVIILPGQNGGNTEFANSFGGGPMLINAAKVGIDGVETEIMVAPTRGLILGLSYAYLNARYKKLDPLIVASGSLNLDTPLPLAPKYSYTAQIQYRRPVLNGFGSAQLTYAQNGVQYSGSDENTQWKLPKLGLLNARLDYSTADRTWTVGVYGRNLTDKEYLNGGFSTSSFGGGRRDFLTGGADMIFPGAPREFGVDFSYRFGQ